MKFIKKFENYNFEFLVCELLTENKYSDVIHLIELVINENEKDIEHLFDYSKYAGRIFKPEVSSTFRLIFLDNQFITDYGYKYKILYRTKDKQDAINNYEFLIKTQKYNL